MLEGKPNIRKYYPIPDFDQSVWEDYWAYLEQEQIPVYMHVNDPEGTMHGLGLDNKMLDKIYSENFLHFIKAE